MSDISERGPWTAHSNGRQVSIHSGDFTHDVALIVTGDFAEHADKLRYAQYIAAHLNTMPELREDSVLTTPKRGER